MPASVALGSLDVWDESSCFLLRSKLHRVLQVLDADLPIKACLAWVGEWSPLVSELHPIHVGVELEQKPEQPALTLRLQTDWACQLPRCPIRLVRLETATTADGSTEQILRLPLSEPSMPEERINEAAAILQEQSREELFRQTGLMNEQLKDSILQAEEATRAKSEFLAKMSHELRTPMNAIIGLSHLALRTELSEKQEDYISKVHNAGIHLLGIINDILDFSKIEAGKVELEEATFELDQILEEISNIVAFKAEEKSLEISYHVEQGVPTSLRGDSLRLKQVLINLITNAIKFTETGLIDIHIWVADSKEDRIKLAIDVRDTGIGMSAEQITRLFQAFTQAESSTTRTHGGTGLGLTISRRLLELMGGGLSVSSDPGVGSTFHGLAWLGIAPEANRQADGNLEVLQNWRMLLVDDNPVARSVLEDRLSELCPRIETAASGAEAIPMVLSAVEEGNPYDVIFMDWMMPGLDGCSTAEELERRLKQHYPPVIMVTGFDKDQALRDHPDTAIEGFLTKPVTGSALRKALARITQGDASKAEKPAAGHDSSRWNLEGLRVLLVEDNEINQLIAVELIRAVGGQVVVAQNGLEALEDLECTPSPFHVVLMDLAMPVMDGWEATHRIRSESRWHDLPILAMTAHAFAEERDRCLVAGMQDHLTKPIDPDRLYQALTAYRPESPAPSAAVAAAPAAAAAPGPAGPSLDAPSAANPGAKPLDALREAGVDVAGALRRTAGDQSLYLKLLNSFATTQRTAVEQVEQALASGDHATAERLVHTIKGVAGNLGVMALHSSADALEHALRERAPTDTAQQTFNQCLTSTLQWLDAALHQPELARSGETDPPTPSPAETAPDQGLADTHRDLLHTLAGLIDCGDGEAIELAAREQTLLQQILGDQVYSQLHRQLDDLEFEAALATLQPALGGTV